MIMVRMKEVFGCVKNAEQQSINQNLKVLNTGLLELDTIQSLNAKGGFSDY